MRKCLTYIMALAFAVLITACYPKGDDDSAFGPCEKLIGTWVEDEADVNIIYYTFDANGTCTHGITHCKDPVTQWSKQGTWAVEHEGKVIISLSDEPSQTLDYYASRSSLTLDDRTYHTVGLSITFDESWGDTLKYKW